MLSQRTDRSPDSTQNDHSFNQGVDVSHLATPHITSSISLAARSSPITTPTHENDTNDRNHHTNHPGPSSASCAILHQHQNPPESGFNRENGDTETSTAHSFHQDTNTQPSPPSHTSSPVNLYEPQPSPRSNSPPELDQHRQSPYRGLNPPHQQPQQAPQQQHQQQLDGQNFNSNGTTAKLSYDIISVREPLAKILAERQQLLFAQQQQRQILGDHEYIEVYGERGSSCFYEEIAGSVTSSATYDQIGAVSNHNYQVLINAYAVANRANGSNQDDGNNPRDNNSSQNSNSEQNGNQENMYDVTNHPTDQVDGSQQDDNDNQPSTSSANFSSTNYQSTKPSTSQSTNDRSNLQLSQSIPVYSVINKATRRGNSMMRITNDTNHPPRPPPKNLLVSQQQSIIANHSHQGPPNAQNSSQSNWNNNPSTSSYVDSNSNNANEMKEHQNIRLPQPPPRFSKHPTFNPAADRPLPLPDKFEPNLSNSHNNNSNNNNIDNNNDNVTTDRNMILSREDDIESLNNGYELLRSNFEDDQIDVGYEKIRESNRYSGGSVSSQFCPLQLLDNGGYESVHPIYSSPSNALADANYEAIGPATASELAAAATAKLTAAATVIEKILKDQ